MSNASQQWPGRVVLCVVGLAAGAAFAEVSGTPAHGAEAAPIVLAATTVTIARAAESASTTLAPRVPEAPSHDGLAADLRDGRIITGSSKHRLILFTFDDGPDRRTTPLLLDRLDAAGVKAVFFLTASRIAGRTPMERLEADVAREIVRRGHFVGNHTVDHLSLPRLDDEQALAQVVDAERIFERTFGARPWLMRPPFGAHSERIDRLLADRGYTTMLWNLGTGDFQVDDATQVLELFRKVFERRERENGDRGGIVLLHDTYTWSVDAFELILADLQTRNCELLAQGEELFDVVDDPALFFQARGEANPSVEADSPAVEPAWLAARQAHLRHRTATLCDGADTH